MQIIVEALVVRRWKARQLALAELDGQIAALGDLDRVGERLRNVGKQLRHLGLRLEILVGAETLRPALVGEHVAFGDAHARFVRPEIVGQHELHRMRRHHRQREFGGELQRLLHAVLDLHRGDVRQPLQLEVIAPRKQRRPFPRQLERMPAIAGEQRQTDVAAMGSRQCDQAVARRRRKPFPF